MPRVFRDLALQILVDLAFDFADFAAADAGHVNVIARPVTLVEVAIAAKVKEIELVNQAEALEQVEVR